MAHLPLERTVHACRAVPWAAPLRTQRPARGQRAAMQRACRARPLSHLALALPPPPTYPPPPLQLLKGNSFAGTAFFSYGAFWISWAFINTMVRLHGGPNFVPTDPGFKVGNCLLLATWGCFTFGFFVPTLRKNVCLMVVSCLFGAGTWVGGSWAWDAVARARPRAPPGPHWAQPLCLSVVQTLAKPQLTKALPSSRPWPSPSLLRRSRHRAPPPPKHRRCLALCR